MRTKTKLQLNTVCLLAGCALAGGVAHAAYHGHIWREVKTAQQLVPFSVELNRWSHADTSTPKTLEAMIGSTSFSMVGEFVDVKPGRRAFALIGCDKRDESTGACKGDDKSVIYNAYANIVVKPISILRGTLAVGDAPAHIEIPWPNNLGVDALLREVPRGARVIVIGEPVHGADEAAAPLIARGLATEGDVAANLVSVPSYGLIIETAEGVLAPMWGTDPLVEGKAADVFTSFDGAVAAIKAAAPNAVEPSVPSVPLPMGVQVK
jgi:hypothetical protein